MECLQSLIAIKSSCQSGQSPVFFLDDVEGMTEQRLAQLATPRDGSGKNLGSFLIESAARIMVADIETLIPANYRIQNSLTNICSSCDYTGFYAAGSAAGTGILIKNTSNSRFSSILIDSLKIKTNSTGSFTLRLLDGNGISKDISQDFVAGQILNILNVNFETSAPTVKIFFTDPSVQLAAISCPATSGCGCGGGGTTSVPTDVLVTGYQNGIETATQYGILPCVKIKCSHNSIICELVEASPRLFGLTMLYLVASKSFGENGITQRINRTASFNKEEVESMSDYYYSLYRERLTGNPKKKVAGVSNAINAALANINDKCVKCESSVGIAWAI